MKKKPNDFTSSLKKEKKSIKKELNSPIKAEKSNLIDFFEVGGSRQVNEPVNSFNFNNQSVNKSNQQDLLMDIFSGGSHKEPLNNNQPSNIINLNQINKNDDIFGFNNVSNPVQNDNFATIPININQQNVKKEVNLNDLLKKAYNNEVKYL